MAARGARPDAVNMITGVWECKKNRLRRDNPALWAGLTDRSDAPKTRAPGDL